MKTATAILALTLLTLPAYAQDHSEHMGMNMEGSSGSSSGSSGGTDLYAPSREAMHKDMNVKPTGNADLDFVNNMIPHHQGAVEMVKVQLEHGKDPELRKLAQDIIKAQEAEIKMMKAKQAELQKK